MSMYLWSRAIQESDDPYRILDCKADRTRKVETTFGEGHFYSSREICGLFVPHTKLFPGLGTVLVRDTISCLSACRASMLLPNPVPPIEAVISLSTWLSAW